MKKQAVIVATIITNLVVIPLGLEMVC